VEVDEITIPSPDFANGLTFGPVTIESGWGGPFDAQAELPVAFALHHRRLFGVDWYPGTCYGRGVFSVIRDRITLRLTAPAVIEPAGSWRRFGYWLIAGPSRTTYQTPDAHRRLSRR
jgi:hypothetical protein